MTKSKRSRPTKALRGFRLTLTTDLPNRQCDRALACLEAAGCSRDLARAKRRESCQYEASGRTLMAAWRRASAVHHRFAMRSRALWARVFAGQIGPDDPRITALQTQIEARSILLARALVWQKRGILLGDGSGRPVDERRHELIARCNTREVSFLAQIV